jgi:hypothetical protein
MPGPNAEAAHRLVAKVLAAQPSTLAYDRLQSAWSYAASFDDNVLLTGLDLMVRHGHATLGSDDAAEVTISDSGRVFASEEVPRFSKLMATLNRVLG